MIKSSSSSLLAAEAAEYALYRHLSSGSLYQLTRTIALYGEWLGRQATDLDLNDAAVSRWLRDLEPDYAQRTVYSHRVNLLVLWRDMAKRQLVPPPHRVRRIQKPEPCPIAWTAAEWRSIVQRCRELAGTFPLGDSRSIYCEALVRFAYDSGLRRSDIWRVRRSQITPTGAVVLRQHKTGGAHYPQLRPATVELIGRLPRDPPLSCPYRSSRWWYVFWRQEIIEPAGVRPGCLQQIRRTGATHLDIEHPEAVSDYLGHKTPEMRAHYIDRSISPGRRRMPPELE